MNPLNHPLRFPSKGPLGSFPHSLLSTVLPRLFGEAAPAAPTQIQYTSKQTQAAHAQNNWQPSLTRKRHPLPSTEAHIC